MKRYLLPAALLLASAPCWADCAKSTDACSAGNRKLSPFLEAAMLRDMSSPSAARKRAAAGGSASAARSTKAAAPAAKPAAVAGAAAGAPLARQAPAASSPASPGDKLSSPLWLGFIGAGLAALYFYLAGLPRRARGRKK
jgi:hypothetical protein